MNKPTVRNETEEGAKVETVQSKALTLRCTVSRSTSRLIKKDIRIPKKKLTRGSPTSSADEESLKRKSRHQESEIGTKMNSAFRFDKTKCFHQTKKRITHRSSFEKAAAHLPKAKSMHPIPFKVCYILVLL